MTFQIHYPRVHKERRPEGHEPRAPRYRVTWNEPVAGLACAYFGIQSKQLNPAVRTIFLNTMSEFLQDSQAAKSTEILTCTDSEGYENILVVAYWSDMNEFSNWLGNSGFKQWFQDRLTELDDHGYWFEPIISHFDRHETIFSEQTYKVGLANLPEVDITPMTMNGYFGAARDRLPLSAIDELNSSQKQIQTAQDSDDFKDGHIIARLPHNLTILRSGQFWHKAGEEQANDYEATMQPKLDRGVLYLKNNPLETGCLSLRMATNLDDNLNERAETSVIAAFHSLEHLEKWAASHETHLAIYEHAIKMNRHYGKKREVVTWHELFVLQQGAVFEYINCHPKTGMLPYSETMKVSC